jgi:hypothetical protein
MLQDPNKVVPASELRRLTQGSFEHKIELIREAIEDANPDQAVTIVATYPDKAVVAMGDGFLKVAFEESDSGNLVITSSDPLNVDVRDRDGLDDFVEQEARGVVDLWLSGNAESALERLRRLAPQIKVAPERDEAKLLARVESVLEADRPWKRAYQDRQEQISQVLGSDLQEDRLRPKFRKLYDGSITGAKLKGYADLVSEDLGIVVGRLDQITESAKTAFDGSYDSLTHAQSNEDDAEGVFDLYEGFAVDLIEDLEQLRKQTMTSLQRIKDVGCQGKLRDVLAEGIAPYEVASRFVVKVATLLNEAQEE